MHGYAKETARSHRGTYGAKCRPRGDALEPQPIWRIDQHDDLRIIADWREHRADDLTRFADSKDFPDLQFNWIGPSEPRVLSLRVARKYNEHHQPDNNRVYSLHAFTSIISIATTVLALCSFNFFSISSISVKYLISIALSNLSDLDLPVYNLQPDDLYCFVCSCMSSHRTQKYGMIV